MKTNSVQLSSGRRTLGPLQPSAGDDAVLVGSSGKRRVDLKIVDTKRRRLDFGNVENEPPSGAGSEVFGSGLKVSSPPRSPIPHQPPQRSGFDVLVEDGSESNGSTTPRRNVERKGLNNTGSTVVPREAYDLLLRDDESVDYWKMIAEQRRVALESALDENRQLHEEVDILTAENGHLQKVANQCAELAEIVKTLTATDSDEDDESANDDEVNVEERDSNAP